MNHKKTCLRVCTQASIITKEVAQIFRTCLQFCWAGQADINGKTVVAWSALRKVLREEIIKSHAQSFTSCPNLANVSSASSQDIANAVLDLLGADDTATEAQSSHCVRARSPLAFKVIRRFNYKRT